MKIHGLQKMTLLDFPGRVACTVFLGGCDMRCPFCHNFELVDGSAPALLEEEEFFTFLKKRQGLLDGVAITGGEPCLRAGLPSFIRKIRDLGFAVKLDTNGNHPEVLQKILEDHLADYIAMDIKNSPDKYALTIGLPMFPLENVNRSIGLLLSHDTPFELRTTVVREFHEAADFEKIGPWVEGAQRYFLQCFTDRDTVPYENLHAPSRQDMTTYQEILKKYIPEVTIRGMD